MSGEGILNIGLIAEDINTDYSQDIVDAIYNGVPENRDVKLFVIAGKVRDHTDDDELIHFHKTMYNTIYDFAGHCDLDGLIIALGSLRDLQPGEETEAFLDRFGDIPRVFISSAIGDSIEVKYDNEAGIHEAIDVLVNTDNITKMCMLGGREDNFDVVERREIFKSYLLEKGLDFPDSAYVATDMSTACRAEAAKLLDDNPGVEAVFCVNDAVAKGLYDEMASRGLLPGRDIKVFGFDNTRMAGEMSPPLSSIGPSGTTVGKRALELLIEMLDGHEVTSVAIPTVLYGRASFDFEMYDVASLDVTALDEKGINGLFDICFYRYKNKTYRRENIDLRRLFCEFMTRIISALKRRYMGNEEFADISRMVDIFIDNGAMEYTDTERLMKSLGRIQAAINIREKSVSTNMMVNRVFLRIKDQLIFKLAQQKETRARQAAENQERFKRFLVSGFSQVSSDDDMTDISIRLLGRLGIQNMAFFMYDEPVVYHGSETVFPEEIKLKCVIKEGDLYITSEERQNGRADEVFSREELPSRCRGYLVFPVFCGAMIYGMLACGLTQEIYSMGELVAEELGRALYMSK